MLKMIERIILVPLWIVVSALCLCTKIFVKIYSIVKGFLGIILGIVFIGSLIWFHDELIRFVLLALAEGILFLILFGMVVLEVTLSDLKKNIGIAIIYGL